MGYLLKEFEETKQCIPVVQQGVYSLHEVTNPQWPDLEICFEKYSIKQPCCFLPPENYDEFLFAYACARKRVPAMVGSVYHLKWIAEACQLLQPDCIVSNKKVFPYLFKALDELRMTQQIQVIALVLEEGEDSFDDVEAIVPVETISRPYAATI